MVPNVIFGDLIFGKFCDFDHLMDLGPLFHGKHVQQHIKTQTMFGNTIAIDPNNMEIEKKHWGTGWGQQMEHDV